MEWEFNEVWDETLYRRALRVPKTLDERMIEKERNEIFAKAVARPPKIQRRRFLLYYEYDFNFYQIAEMEHCTASAVQKPISVAREKVKAEMRNLHYQIQKLSYKSKKNIKRPKEDWMRIENTHEPLVDHETWDLVQGHINSRKRSRKDDEPQIFAGLLKCGECGWSLSAANTKNKSRYYWLMAVKENEDAILERLLQSSKKQRRTENARDEKELKRAQKRKQQLDETIKTVSARLEDAKAETDDAKRWVDLIQKYSAIDELTAPLLNELIEKIAVHQWRKDGNGKKVWDIEIYYRFVGKID